MLLDEPDFAEYLVEHFRQATSSGFFVEHTG